MIRVIVQVWVLMLVGLFIFLVYSLSDLSDKLVNGTNTGILGFTGNWHIPLSSLNYKKH